MSHGRTSGLVVDHYELLDHLGDGGHAEVYRAKDLRDGSEVVVKFPLARNLEHPVLVSRWRREVAITESLCHPRIVCRLDGGERHNEPYIVVEYAGNGSLRGWIGTADDPLPVDQAVAWGRQLAEALAFLHGVGVVHQDVKPDNILVADDLTIKLGDFGAAIALRHGHPTHPWRRLGLPAAPEGTAGYVSPEQIIGQSGDERSDIYGWGVVMYELLTAQVPFADRDQLAALTAHLTDDPLPVRALRPAVPPALEAVVMKAMRRHPRNRYASVAELLADLDRLDFVDLATFDLGAEDPITTPVGGHELTALLRLIAVVMVSFLTLVTAAIALTALLH